MVLLIRVERVNLFLVDLLQMAATELHARGERSVLNAELGVNHQHPFQLFELGEVLIQLFDDLFVE